MSPDVVSLIREFERQHLASFGWRRPVPQLKTGEYKWYKNFELLLGRLQTDPVFTATTYFQAIFAWIKFKGKRPRTHTPNFYCSETAWSIATHYRDRVLQRTAQQLADQGHPFDDLKTQIEADVRTNCRMFASLIQQYQDPFVARQVGLVSLSPYFWCFDPMWGDDHLQALVSPSLRQAVHSLWTWFVAHPSLKQAAQAVFQHEYAAASSGHAAAH